MAAPGALGHVLRDQPDRPRPRDRPRHRSGPRTDRPHSGAEGRFRDLIEWIRMFESELAFAVETVRSAVRICRQVQGEIAPGRWDKQDRTPVTVADLGVQAVVSAALQERYPHD